jgi:ring-1,2-phenylacetyl-CoA epoxidase subunit PaaE
MEDLVKTYFQTLIGSFVVMGFIYFVIWYLFGKKLNNRKIQLSKRAGWSQIKEEMWHAALSLIGATIFQILVFSLRDTGMTKLYEKIEPYGIPYFIFSVVVLLFVSDAWFYWLHRAMHHPRVYKYVHALHHKSLDVNPFTSNSFHVVEALALTLWVLPLVMIMPISAMAFGIVQVLGTFNNLKSHLGYELFPNFFKGAPFNMLVTATNHSLHHTQYNGNYGLYFRYWDQWFGTELNSTDKLFREIHSRKNEQIVDNTKYKTIKIDRLVKETSDTVSVYFKPDDQQFYHYQAGQYLTIRVKIGKKTYDRCFSISSSPTDDFLRITVKLKGEVSHYFYNDAKTGDAIQSLYPVGEFLLPKETDNQEFVMIAGGSGITPLYSMIRTLLNKKANAQITLLYANKSSENIIFREELGTLAAQNANFTYQSFTDATGRISVEDLKNHTNAHFYICGPDGLKSGMTGHLKNLKVDKEKINVEHYADGYVPWFGLF